ncbi:peptidylprolyl isomerase [Myxococcota bacterium]
MAALGSVPSANADSGSPVVLRVGSAQLTLRELQERLAAVPAFQVAAWGTPEQAKRRFINEVLVRELLLGQEAAAQQLERSPAVAQRMAATLARTLAEDIERQVSREHPVTPEEVRREFDAQKQKLSVPRRLRLFRILVSDASLVGSILAESRGRDGLSRWARLARDKSLDRATRMRSGDLGFVRADGTTDVPTVRVAPALFAAADRVSDGELVPQPVKEGERLAVVWRRGSLRARIPSLELHAPAIERQLLRQRVHQALAVLVERLRTQYAKVHDLNLLDRIPIQSLDGGLRLPVRPESAVE